MSYYLERIQRGVDYIEARLDDEIALADVAREAGISQWHFQRIFKALTGETLKTYIRSRRLAGSLDRLLSGRQRILDIALLAGFESQEAFARAFKKAFGIAPQQYRNLGRKSLFLKKPQFDAEYLQHLQTNLSLEPELIDQPAMTLVGLHTQFFSSDSEKNNIGEQLPPLWNAFLPRRDQIPQCVPVPCYGVVRQEHDATDRLEYFAAVEVHGTGTIPEGMCEVDIPAGTYARFTHRGAVARVDHTVSYAYSTWLARSGRRHLGGPDLEIYGPSYHPTSEDSVIHYAIPIG